MISRIVLMQYKMVNLIALLDLEWDNGVLLFWGALDLESFSVQLYNTSA
jgi:hypothetical protein